MTTPLQDNSLRAPTVDGEADQPRRLPRLKARLSHPWTLLALALAAHVLILAIYFGPAYPRMQSTLGLYWDRGSHLVRGDIPYRDFPWEYPPLSLVLTALPRLFASTYDSYRLAYAVEMGLVDLALVVLTSAWARGHRFSPASALIAQAAFLAGAGEMIVLERFDIVPAACMLLALYLWPRSGGRWSWFWLAIGTAIKLYPAVLVPLLAVDHARRRDWRGLIAGALVFGSTIIVTALPFLIREPAGLAQFLSFQGGRGVQLESLMASFLLLAHLVGYPLTAAAMAGSVDVVSPLTPLLSNLTLPLIGLSALLVVWRYARRPTSDERRLRYAAAAVIAFMLTNKVLSAQFIIWPYALLPLITTRRSAIWEMYFVALCLTQAIYPYSFGSLAGFELLAVTVQVARNGLLLVIWFVLLSESPARTVA